MANFNVFVLWTNGTWEVFTTKTDSISSYITEYRLANVGKIVEVFYERWSL